MPGMMRAIWGFAGLVVYPRWLRLAVAIRPIGLFAGLPLILGLSGCGGAVPIAAPTVVEPSDSWAASVALKPDLAPVSKPMSLAALTPGGTAVLAPAGVHKPSKIKRGGGYRKVGKPYQINGKLYVPAHDPDYQETGIASWYGEAFHAKKTANGETYDMNALSAAHRTMPLPSFAYVTNLANGRKVLVRVNDRGPFKNGRIIDVSKRVADELGFKHHGTARVRVEYAGPAPLDGSDHKERKFLKQAANR
jgi:rare lipoprotein A (peptidoglycan hydrolase)